MPTAPGPETSAAPPTGAAPPIGAPHPSRPWLPALVFTAAALVLIAAAIVVLSLDEPVTRRRNPRTDNAYIGGDITRIAARVQGYIVALPIADNQFVRAGDVIARIEDSDFRAQLDQADAALQTARAQRAAIDGQRQELTDQIAQSRTAETSSIANVSRTRPELVRQERLVNTDAGVRRALEQAQADNDKMQAALAGARARTKARLAQVDALEAQTREADATIAARQADLDLARLNLGWTTVTAPIAGTLGARLVRPGDYAAPGTQLVSVTPLDGVWVDANFTERQVADIRVGQRATIRVDAFPGEVLQGHVTGLSPLTGGQQTAIQPDNTTGNFTKVVQRVPVRIAIEWRDSPLRGLLRPGLSAVAEIETDAS